MPKRAILLLLLQCVTAAAFAQSVQVETPPGDYLLFASPGAALTDPPEQLASKGGITTLPVKPGFDHVYVSDQTTGALAEKAITPTTKEWNVAAADFTHMEHMTVAAEHNGDLIGSGEISLGDGDPRHTVIVDRSAPAAFFDVKIGKLNVTVKYRKKDGTTGQVTQVFSAAPSPRILNLVVALPDDVATGPGAASPGASAAADVPGPPKSPAPSQASPVGSFVVWLVVLVVVGFIVYNITRFMKSNPGTVGQKLQQLGVQVPQPGDHGLSPAQPIIPPDATPAPQPVQKIDLGNATPDPTPAFQAAPAASASMGQPSLMASSGVAIPLGDGETVVGREPGLGLSLTADSTVSRRHATLQKVGSEVTVTDLGSSNGTYVNGAKISVPTVLRQGDAVQFGSAKFQYLS